MCRPLKAKEIWTHDLQGGHTVYDQGYGYWILWVLWGGTSVDWALSFIAVGVIGMSGWLFLSKQHCPKCQNSQ